MKYPSYSQFTDIDFAYEDFISKTILVVDKIAPEKKVRVKGSNQDWFDNEVHEAIRNHNIIYKYQSGFRTNHSTNSCLSYLSDKIQNGLVESKFTGMILIDLQKAFDTIDREILLLKMKYLGFAESTINWFRSYLEERTFLVDVNGVLSNPGNLALRCSSGIYFRTSSLFTVCQ